MAKLLDSGKQDMGYGITFYVEEGDSQSVLVRTDGLFWNYEAALNASVFFLRLAAELKERADAK